jgi:tetratricopeptide (TPR) repeat protein
MRADLERILQRKPDHAWALAYRAAYHQWQGDLIGAMRDYAAALVADQTQAWIWAFRANLHLRQRDFASARADFQQAITLDPGDPWIRRQWAWLLWEKGQARRAVEVLDSLIEEWPDDGYARLARAELHLLEEEWEAACLHLQAIIKLGHPLSWLAHAVLAVFTTGSERAEHLARAEQERASPTFWGFTQATVLAQAALVAWLHGEYGSAARLLRQAREEAEPGETLWRALAPLLKRAGALLLLPLLPESQHLYQQHLYPQHLYPQGAAV